MLPHQSDTLSVSDACRYLSPLSQTKIVAWSEQVGKPHPKFKRQPLASINANSSSSPSKRLRTDSEEMDNEQSPSKSIKRTTSPVKPSGRLTRASTRLETAQAEPIHEDNKQDDVDDVFSTPRPSIPLMQKVPRLPPPPYPPMGLSQTDEPPVSPPSSTTGLTGASEVSDAPSQASRASSPSKTGRQIKGSFPESAITMAFLGRCEPSVRLLKPIAAKRKARLPDAVSDLLDKLQDIPTGTIPLQFKPDYERSADTPRKSFKAPSASDYMDKDAPSWMKNLIDRLIVNSDVNHAISAHERQWTGDSVATLMGALEMADIDMTWKKLNVEDCTIEPSDLKMQRVVPGLSVLEDKVKKSKSDATKTKSKGQSAKSSTKDAATQMITISKMVDYSAGLILDEDVIEVLNQAYKQYAENERSLNQTLGPMRDFPIFLDIEVKKESRSENPEIQLAIWAAGAFQKKRYHNWDTSFPMPGISVRGPEWSGYIFYESDGQLIMMGPIHLGSSDDLIPAYNLVHRLELLIEWGRTEYKQWWTEHVFSYYKKTLSEGRQYTMPDV